MAKNAICVWDFTIPMERITADELKLKLKEWAKSWCFQGEKGEKTDYKHWQGRLSLKIKSRKGPEIIDGTHWSITSDENKDNMFYMLKEDTRIEGPWKDDDEKPAYIPRQIREIKELYPWQKSVIESAKKWDTRTINILYDENGNKGKSIVKTYMGCHNIGRSIPFTNDYRDMMRMVMDTNKMRLYIIDLPRAMKKEHLFQFFSGIETLKDGYAYDDRYHFKEEYFDSPNIWVFMNILPEMSYLTADRWRVWRINYNMELEDMFGNSYDKKISGTISACRLSCEIWFVGLIGWRILALRCNTGNPLLIILYLSF